MAYSPDYEFNDELKKLIDSDNFFTQFEIDIIKHLRNKKSQQYMNKKLGYNFNQYAKWENGTKKVLWSDVINILKIQKINLSKDFLGRFISNTTSLDETGPQFVQFFLKSYFKDDIKLFTQYLKVTVPRARRMIKDKNVSFNTMLQLFIYRPINMIYFLKENKIIHHFPEFETAFQKLKYFEQLEALYPFDLPLSTKNIIGFKLYLTTKKVANEIDELLLNTYHKISMMLKETQETPEDEVLVKVLTQYENLDFHSF